MVLKFKIDTNKWNFHFIIKNNDYLTDRTLLYVGWFDEHDYFERKQIYRNLWEEDRIIISKNFLKRYLRYKHDF